MSLLLIEESKTFPEAALFGSSLCPKVCSEFEFRPLTSSIIEKLEVVYQSCAGPSFLNLKTRALLFFFLTRRPLYSGLASFSKPLLLVNRLKEVRKLSFFI